MPVTQKLIENGRILLVTFVDPWTTEELLQLFPEGNKYYAAAEQPIHALLDVSRIKSIAPGALRAREAPFKHPMSGYVAIVGANTVARTLGETIFKLARFQRFSFFNTYEEGLAFLRARIAEESLSQSTQG
jgi:hypothetical protein